MDLEEYIDFQNHNLEDYNPLIEFIDEPIYLYDIAADYMKWTSGFFQYTDYDYRLNQFITHIYAYRKPKGKSVEIQEVARRSEKFKTIVRRCRYSSYGGGKGFYALWGKVRANKYYYSDFVAGGIGFREVNDWYDERIKMHGAEINAIENLIAQDVKLQYCSYNKDSYVNLLDYIKCYRKYPVAEITMKLGLYRFSTNEKALKTITENKFFRKWIYLHQEECQGLAFQTVYNSFKKNPNGSVDDYYNSLMYRIECGKDVASANKELYHKVLKYTTQERLKAYFDSQNITKQLYFDYIKACDFLRLDLNDTKVLFPKNFMAMHDNYTMQYHRAVAKAEDEKKQNISIKMSEVADRFKVLEIHGDRFSIIIAKSKYDLIEESSVLSHCVGRMDYDLRQANGKSMICFVRKNEELDKPFVTLELGLEDLKVKQCYGIHNSTPDAEVKAFVDGWQHSLKGLLKGANQAQIN